MADSKRLLKVFLCHARADKQKVRELYRYLLRRRIKPWFDEIDLVGGQDWQVEIPKALATSDAIIICLTKNSVDKEGYIQKEIKFALDKALEMPEGRIFLIPVRFEECEVPFALSRYQWVDLFDEAGYTRMMKALKFRASQLERATVDLPMPPVITEEERIPFEKNKQESIEKAVREEAERESAEKAERERIARERLEKAEREAVEKARLQAEEDSKRKIAKEKAKRDAEKKPVEKIQPEILKKLPSQKNKPDREISRIQKPETQISQRQSANQASFWVIGSAVIIFVIVMISLNNQNTPQTFVPTSTRASSPTKTPVAVVTPTKSLTLTPAITLTNTIVPTSTNFPTEITDAKGVEMVLVPSGKFTMGRDAYDVEADCNCFPPADLPDVEPAHEVYLDAFYMDKYEVTNKLYKDCVNEGECSIPINTSHFNDPSYIEHPVAFVNWNQATAYCNWRGGSLPAEAQWEKAARGIDARIYPWGDNFDGNLVNYCNKNCSFPWADTRYSDGYFWTAPVGSFENGKSIYGIYDLVGNVQEWVMDWYSEDYYQNSPESNPSGPELGQDRVVRGSSWDNPWWGLTAYNRYYANPEINSSDIRDGFGFRCVRNVNP